MLSTLIPKNACAALAVSSLLLLAACGGGGDSGPGAAPVSQQPTPSAAAPEVVLADTYTDLVAGTAGSKPGWAAWVGPASGAVVAGLGCTVSGNYHQHSLVTIYKDGVRMGPPDNVGRGACDYELHTHDLTGMVHLHADVEKKFMLGQFFALWGQPLTPGGTAGLPGPVRFYVIENEKLTPYAGDPAQLELVPHREIVIVSGTPPGVLPKYRWPGNL